ncbi:hypothetical protein KY493_12580 [Brevundimonas sp. PAMC22021]|nr:hypothetical protein KY493_12580 [Brevundimonas sp. PAMC22021]
MRRVLIWSILALVVGALLVAAGYWAYWNFYSRFQPVTISRAPAEIQRLLDEASWVSPGGGDTPLYIVAYHDNPAARRFEREEAPRLRAAGVDVRAIVFARPDRNGQRQSTAAERATVAELWLTRDWTLYERWSATPARQWPAEDLPNADRNLARAAVVEAGQVFAERLTTLLREAGVEARYPIVLWRDRQGFLKACACADDRSWAFVRDDLDASGRSTPARTPTDAEPPAEEPPAPEPQPAPVDPGLPYPNLPAIPPSATPPGASPPSVNPPAAPTPQTAPNTQPQAPAAAPRSPRPAQPRQPPQAKRGDDTTFY